MDIAFRREVRSAQEAPEYLRPQYAKFWSSVHSLDWWKQHWDKTGLVYLQYAEFLPESEQILHAYWTERASAQEDESIMRAAHHDPQQIVGLVRLVAIKR